MIKQYLTIALLAISAMTLQGQAPAQYTQYMYNTISLNPGYTGTTRNMEGVLFHRSQWTGLEGAPTTQSFGIHGRMKNRLGVGVTATNDKLGPSNRILANINAAYEIPVSALTKLSFGINAGADVLNVDWSKGLYYDINDPQFAENVNTMRPVLGSGLYLYSDNWYTGFSATNFFNSEQYDEEERMVTDRKTQYYLMAGYVMTIGTSLKFKPALLTKHVAGAPLTFDVSANFLFNDRFTVGLSYRVEDALSALAGFQINQNFFVGYSYDYSMGGLSAYNDGSHEIMLRYSVFDKTNRALSPRFF